MKVFCFFAALAIGAAAASSHYTKENRLNGVNGWHVPKVGGGFDWIYKEDADKRLHRNALIKERARADPALFYLYTNSNRNSGTQISSLGNSISSSQFNPKNPTRFIIHGWTDSYLSPLNAAIREAWFTKGNFNMISVDWSRARSKDYIASVEAIPDVGKQVAALIDYLHNNHGMSLDSLIVIGHSLGAHVAGYTGKNVKSGKIGMIMGLDPAMPLFWYSDCAKRLCTTDAAYVESIQTCGDKLGFVEPIGKGAFYPHGGKDQPGCGIDLDGHCSHQRSWQYYSEAVTRNDFPAYECPNYKDAVRKEKCGGGYSNIRMGAMKNTYKVAGNFYVPVNSAAPFGMN